MSAQHRRNPDDREPQPNIRTLTDAEKDEQRYQREQDDKEIEDKDEHPMASQNRIQSTTQNNAMDVLKRINEGES